MKCQGLSDPHPLSEFPPGSSLKVDLSYYSEFIPAGEKKRTQTLEKQTGGKLQLVQ